MAIPNADARFSCSNLKFTPHLDSGGLKSEAKRPPPRQRIAIVGHEPDLSGLIESILGVAGGAVMMKKGAIACLRLNPPARHGTLKFLIPPKLADEGGEQGLF